MDSVKQKQTMRQRIAAVTDFREFMILYIIVLTVIAMAYAVPQFLGGQNISAVLLSMSDQSIIATGMTILLISGGFDLSVGSTVGLSGAVTAIWLTGGMPAGVAILMGLAVGVLIGLINGLLIAEVGINPFVTTLGMMSLVRGMHMVVTEGQNISNLPKAFTALGQGYFYHIQYPIIISLVLVCAGDFLLRRSRFFRQNYYIGGNEKAAILSGINVKGVKVFNYVLTGLLAAFAGVIITARLGSASTTAGQGLELKVISAVIIGGASLRGGVGTVAGAFLGALLMSIIISSINLLSIDIYWVDFAMGAALLAAVIVDKLSKQGNELL